MALPVHESIFDHNDDNHRWLQYLPEEASDTIIIQDAPCVAGPSSSNSRLTHMGKKMLPVESVPTVHHVHISYGPRTTTRPGHNQIPVKEI